MPELDFKVVGIESAVKGFVPLLQFRLEITNAPLDEVIESVLLQAQIQIQPAQRSYAAREKERLSDLFGTPERWGQTLLNRLWTHTQATVRRFSGRAEVLLPVTCTYDLNVLATKYFDALQDGEIALLFLFSGSVFHIGPEAHLQIQQISWDKECAYRMPVKAWKELMEFHYPNSAWVSLRKDVFDELNAYKRRHGLVTWEATMEKLLSNEITAPARPGQPQPEQKVQGRA